MFSKLKAMSISSRYGLVQLCLLRASSARVYNPVCRFSSSPSHEVSISPLEPSIVLPYAKLNQKLQAVRKAVQGRPLTLTEKILFAHLRLPEEAGEVVRGESYLLLDPDRVAMQDATAQMVVLQFAASKMAETCVPTSIHCDHLIVAQKSAVADLDSAVDESREIFDFLGTAAEKFGIGFWKPGAGIIHQVLLENYAFPAGLMIGCDSHTPNAGGLGMVAIGVGGADAVDVMVGLPWELKAPKIIGVHLTGQLGAWGQPKDIILHLAGVLGVEGGTGAVLEYYGPGVETLSATGMATVANMGAEVGATSTLFPHTQSMTRYLQATDRSKIAQAVQDGTLDAGFLSADPSCVYDRVVDIDLSALEPHINGPFTPDLAWPLSAFKGAVAAHEWPTSVSAALIGSCTNSSYEDLDRCARLLDQAWRAGVKLKSPLFITPGSELILRTIARDGQLGIFQRAGAQVLANACGPCCGNWVRADPNPGQANSIVTSYNRNFIKRTDGNPLTHCFLTSPELTLMLAFAGTLSFNPQTDAIVTETGQSFRFSPPTGANELPPCGVFEASTDDYQGGSEGRGEGKKREEGEKGGKREENREIELKVDPKSKRLQLLDMFAAWHGNDITDARVLIKVKGKCTTDHISMAGPWMKYRGHLDNISNNLLIGAVNADNQKVNTVWNHITQSFSTVPDAARALKAASVPWIIVADANYGEGSSREHAALEPRYLGCLAVIARSFARIHETNLKKQGILPLWFASPTDYDKICGTDVLAVTGLDSFAPGVPLTVQVRSVANGPMKASFAVNHSFNAGQIDWFKAGSALNHILNQQQKRKAAMAK